MYGAFIIIIIIIILLLYYIIEILASHSFTGPIFHIISLPALREAQETGTSMPIMYA
jgi:hypothetical protein